MKLRFFCGGSDMPFVFEASPEEAMEIVERMNDGDIIHMISEKSVVHFNPQRIDAIMVMEQED